MVIAFIKFKSKENLSIEERQKEWLKDYEGLYFSIGENKFDCVKWKENKENYIYSDKRFNEPILCLDGKYRSPPNKIQRHKQRLVIEFDDKKDKEKDKEKININIQKVKAKLKEKGWGYIESTHNGASNYIWIEFNRELTSKEAEQFLLWIAPEDSEIDLNFKSDNFRFPILFAEHWKYPKQRELPIEFFEGEQIDFDNLDLAPKSKVKKINIEGYNTGRIFSRIGQAETFIRNNPLFYDKNGLWWKWKFEEYKYELVDETDILNSILDELNIDVIGSTARNEIINSLKQVGRRNIPKKIKDNWIQFKDTIYDITNGKRFKVSSEYFVTNPVAYKLHKDNFELTPTMDKIFEEWVGKEYVKTLYEIIAYCLLPSYPIHRLFCFVGAGMNGKSKFLELLRNFIGESNCCSTELDTLINSRFEITRLHKKLVCQLGETNFNEISKTSILKKLTGGDLIGFEYKGKNPFEDKNYAKIIIATNNLPATTDKTVGFYRRWMIIDFPNQFTEARDILLDIPEEEYESLALKCAGILYNLIKERKFHKEGSIEDRMERYEAKSNFLDKFVRENIKEDFNGHITISDFYKKFSAWCKENRHREMSETSVGIGLKKLGFEQERKYFNWMFEGKGGYMRIWVGKGWKN